MDLVRPEAMTAHAVDTRTGYRTAQEAVKTLSREFRLAGLAEAELDARLIVRHFCGLSREIYVLDPDRRLSDAEAVAIQTGCKRRLAREPVSRITGKREFWGRDFIVGEGVLDPRPDTETLVEAALEFAQDMDGRTGKLKILDLGTGSGCVLLSLLAELPGAWGVGVDTIPSALEAAQENARRFSLAERSAFVCGDWLDPISGPFDIIVANPPYIPSYIIPSLSEDVCHYDPLLALDGGLDGLDAYRAIAAHWRSAAPANAAIFLEAGIGQASDIIQIFMKTVTADQSLSAQCHKDLAGINRVVAIKRQTGSR